MNINKLILASSSRYRRELLARLGLPFESWSPDVAEAALDGEAPTQTALRLAIAKANAASLRWPGAWIIGSDQVADLDGRAIGKPGTIDRAREQLRAMSGKTVLFHTAVCLLGGPHGVSEQRLVTTQVAFRTLAPREIDRYLEREPALDCAGSAKSEALGITLLAHLRGDDPTALVGLPLIALGELLRAEGFEVP